jgi:uncharacterized protein (TIGR00725 family)
LPHPPLAIGVMGSASGDIDASTVDAVRRLGRAVAEHGCTLITGGCPGLPQAAVEGAKAAGGLVVGISPALSETEHRRRFHSPVDGFDVMIYTGSGLMGREVVNIRSSDIVVVVGGRSGTLGEFAIAYDEGRLIGVLTGTGGVADTVAAVVDPNEKPTGAHKVYDDDPVRLVARLVEYYRRRHYLRPSTFHEPNGHAAPPPSAASPATPAPGPAPVNAM